MGVDWQEGSIDDGYYDDTLPCVRPSVVRWIQRRREMLLRFSPGL